MISDHAAVEIQRRNIQPDDIQQVFRNPQQVLPARPGRQIYQSIIDMNEKSYLIRLIIDEGNPPILVTAYRTSKIKKYWRQP